MVFTRKAALTQLLFVVFLFALLIPMAIWDSNSQVKVSFDDTAVQVKSDKYTMVIPYSDIASAELAALPQANSPVTDSFDDDIIRTGVWNNDTWGDYHITADLDASNCVVVHLTDGRVFVFSRKNDATTAELHGELLTHLN